MKKHTIEYIGCSWEDLRTHLENQFEKEAERSGHPISWENQGEWHIDHIIPLKFENPSVEEVILRLHWENTQPLWALDNIAKGNRFIG